MRIFASIADPDVGDNHTATILWGDGTGVMPITNVTSLSTVGESHTYGDNGDYVISLIATDSAGAIAIKTINVTVLNEEPILTWNTPLHDRLYSFPSGKEYVVVEVDEVINSGKAKASDFGSDDLAFLWEWSGSTVTNMYYNNGKDADPSNSPAGTFPFRATDRINVAYNKVGIDSLRVTVTDDDGAVSRSRSTNILVTGKQRRAKTTSWWKEQYWPFRGDQVLSSKTTMAYIDMINALSSVFSKDNKLRTRADVYNVLYPTGGSERKRARKALLVAWLQFVSGAIQIDEIVPTGKQRWAYTTVLDLLTEAESVILDRSSRPKQLERVRRDLKKITVAFERL